jgi:hypothetical protein
MALDPRASAGRVPLNDLESARALRTRLETAWQRWSTEADKLLLPFQANQRVADKHFERLVRDWRQRLPKPGRLAVHARYQDGRLRIGETRLAPSSVRLPGWPADDDEPCVTLVLREILIVPKERIFRASDVDLAVFGLHAIGRRLERGASREDFDIGQDCHALGKHYPALAVGKAPDFKIFGISGGAWVGKVMVDGASERPFLLVRTFTKAEQAGGFSFADAVSRVTKDGRDMRWSG